MNEDKIEELISEIAYLGDKLNEISKCLKKMSNWSKEDEEKFSDKGEIEE